eukprot:CAMPEP_0201236454 /NCGR_PEP_ID=MMETSP0852-20130820/7891_1 /ASSEMBLY_ACC=CAM_ASM_000632 /TAXON_ID=183588 /ORGANISM="Pseudo-nitzschia fraudulenta, Strain WWA7" /LENGTH=48 /DNA_ID= /DNA_START= /DNA_END= /DNA_ORIENTATION=
MSSTQCTALHCTAVLYRMDGPLRLWSLSTSLLEHYTKLPSRITYFARA